MLTEDLPDFSDAESEQVQTMMLATSQESTATAQRFNSCESESDGDEEVRRELLEISDNTLETGQKADESLLELRDFEVSRKSDEVAYEQEVILALEREGKVSPEEIARLWNNLAAKAMEGIREVEELERRFEEIEEEEGEEEPQVISSKKKKKRMRSR